MDPQQFNRFQEKATGRVPIARDPSTQSPSLSLPTQRPLRYIDDSTTPETPLRPSPAFGAENIAAFVAGYGYVKGPKALIALGQFAWTKVLVGGVDYGTAAFWGANWTMPGVERFFHGLQNDVLGIRVPDRPDVPHGSAVERLFGYAPSDDELQRLFDTGLIFGPEFAAANIAKLEEQKRRYLADYGNHILRTPFISEEALQGRIDAYKQGVAVHQIYDAKRRIVAFRGLALLDLIRRVGILGPAQSDDIPATPAGSADP